MPGRPIPQVVSGFPIQLLASVPVPTLKVSSEWELTQHASSMGQCPETFRTRDNTQH